MTPGRGLLAVLVAALVCAAAPARALAHPMPTSAVLLDIGAHDVRGELELPVDRLAVALGRPLTPAQAAGTQRAAIARYAAAHVRVTGADGRAWPVAVGGGRIARVAGRPDLVLDLRVTPPGGRVTDFRLAYDVIIEQLVTHKAIATIRTQWRAGTTAHDPQTLGVFDWSTRTIAVDGDRGSWLRGLVASAGLGVQHIATGADHLLFLLMLLVPAPLVARAGRWRPGGDGRRSAVRVVHVVTAFAVGHSTTLALAALGVLRPPSALVESLIAVSILVSAVHALRPLIPRGEPLIAAGFGLVHGLAFATLLGDLGLSGAPLVSTLLGFNLGIELTQLLVVALIMPSLYVLSLTRAYPVVRVGGAVFGIVLSGAWLLERTGVLAGDPFASLSASLIAHPFAVAAAFAALALAALAGGAGRYPAAAPQRSG